MRRLLCFAVLASLLVPRAARAGDPYVLVHIASPEKVTLERYVEPPDMPWAADWQFVCTSPCDARVPRESTYRINGDGVRASRKFVLAHEGADRVTLTVDPAHTSSVVGGVLGIVGGSVLSLGGMIYVVVAGLSGMFCGVNDPCPERKSAAPGVVMIIGGAVLVVASALSIHASHTNVDGSRDPLPRDAWLRAPEARGPGWSAPKPTILAPVLTLRF